MSVWVPVTSSQLAGDEMQKLSRKLINFLHYFLLGWITTSNVRNSVLCDRFTPEGKVTYCLGITTQQGLVLASDSRTNAGFDQVNVCRKMYRFVQPGERVFVILTSGSLSISQSVITLLRWSVIPSASTCTCSWGGKFVDKSLTCT